MQTFKTKKYVQEHLVKCGFDHYHDMSEFFAHGQYILGHGEYNRPHLVPARYKGGWGIAWVPSYYANTAYAPKRQRVDVLEGEVIVFQDEYAN
jgi:hypothetical protein